MILTGTKIRTYLKETTLSSPHRLNLFVGSRLLRYSSAVLPHRRDFFLLFSVFPSEKERERRDIDKYDHTTCTDFDALQPLLTGTQLGFGRDRGIQRSLHDYVAGVYQLCVVVLFFDISRYTTTKTKQDSCTSLFLSPPKNNWIKTFSFREYFFL